MRYSEFEELFSAKRMQKYLAACNNDTRRAMTLYRYNLRLSQETRYENPAKKTTILNFGAICQMIGAIYTAILRFLLYLCNQVCK